MNIFECRDYKDFLRAQIKANKERRGYRSELAEAAGCQLSFLSQVLHSHVHLTPDHAAGLASFWRFDLNEQDYFLELVGFARAGSKSLKAILLKRLEMIRTRHENLAKRYQKKDPINPEHQALYYSSWHLAAVHVLLTIPTFNTVDVIAKRLGLSPVVIQEALEQLAKIGLAKKQGMRWQPTQSDIHLPNESALTSMNHSNWRSRAVLDSYRRESGSVHYTAVHSLSKSDVEKIKEMVLVFLDQTRAVVRPSKEEELACLVLDWFIV